MTHYQENRLERMLRLTAEDRSNYKLCLATLLDSEVFYAAPLVGKDNEKLFDDNGNLQINMRRTQEGIKVAHFYSSLQKLQDAESDAYQRLSISGLAFILHNRGRGLALNPGHLYGIYLNSDDVWRLRFFNHEAYLAEVAEVEERNMKSREPKTAKILDFSAFRSKRT